LLRMSLKKAIANSAATIILIAAVGAALKNATLSQHGISMAESIKIAAVVIPSAVISGFLGARLMHALPKKYVRMAFVALLLLASYE
ncbi:MAG: TSUP family transporter, partial [Candidatus Omnitrophota bacterium]